MSWNADQYLKFAAPRLQPALDLLSRVEGLGVEPALAVDLGCGTGSATQRIAQRWPRAEVIGVDGSADMLARAAPTGSHVRWVQGDIARWQPPAPADLIFSNAALHWLPDHAALFDHLLASLAAGGVLAVQMPSNFDAPSHTTIGDTVRAGPWRARLEPLLRPPPVAPAAWYHALLAPRTAALEVWTTEYLHRLSGAVNPVMEWTKGTWLAPFLQALPDDAERRAFEQDYAARVRAAYPPGAEGPTLFPFRRLFIVAVAGPRG